MGVLVVIHTAYPVDADFLRMGQVEELGTSEGAQAAEGGQD